MPGYRLFCVAMFQCCSTFAFAADWEVIPEKSHHVQISVKGEVIDIRTTGADPFLVGNLSKLASKDRVLEFEYLGESGVNELQVYVGPPFGAKTQCDLPGCESAKTWRTYSAELIDGAKQALAKNPKLLRIDFGRKPGVHLQIRNPGLRPQNDADRALSMQREQQKKLKRQEAKRIRDYLQEKYPVSIESIQVKRDQIELTGGGIPKQVSLSDLRLVEYPSWHSIGSEDSGIVLDARLESRGDRWQATVRRTESGRDRLHSGWRLQFVKNDQAKFITSRKFATDIETVTKNFPRQPAIPANQKGMGGIMQNGPLEELIELGVSAITVNIPLTAFVALRQSPGVQPIDVAGPPAYFNPRAFQKFDSLIDWAGKNDIVVTAILLVPTPKNSSAPHPLVHPQNDGGSYAMPNLATERGAIIYGHVLDALAKHYSNSEKSPGGITNWLAHNEIDYHTVWTNMGRQPAEIVTETYYRSMRMIYNAAVQHNPHARVFTSTTHHWYMPEDEQWKTLAPADLYVSLQRYSNHEGDFGWGVGYHPYPANLRAPVAWEDRNRITNDIKTPLITIQNIEVLGEFFKLEFMADSDGKPRPILLSEQGFNSVTYSDEDQANQAGSLVYAMQKIRSIPNVESFHYHRWIDHEGESGVNFGLRTLPTKTEKFGQKKRSWEAYQAFGTPREDEVIRGLPGP